MTLATGVRLGPYEILSPLGAGGMGEVYRARDSRLGRDVAIKVLAAQFSADPERLHRFEQEARAAAALNHPNILAVYDIGSHDSAPYIVSELLEGQTLRERLAPAAARRGAEPLPVRKAIESAVQIAHGLAAAHDKGILHRDLKPDNIFVTADGRVKILDFGLAKLTQSEVTSPGLSALPTTPPHTSPGVVLGTVGYMAPEQVRGVAADQRSDIFALGTILYEMLSGRRAFAGDTAMDSMTAILKEDPPDLPLTERHIPPVLGRIVDRCLEKSPAARFQTATDLAFALDALSAPSGSTPALATAQPPRRGREGRWRPYAPWTIAIVAVLASVALSLLALSHRPPDLPVMRFDIATPPTADPSSFALSPDGLRLVFVAETDGLSKLWLRPLDQTTAQPLAATDGATFPFWAPDSHAVGFFADGKLKRLELAGGTPQPVTEATAPQGGTWSRDGVILFGGSASGLMRVAATGGAPTSATFLAAGEGSHRFPQFLPDGRHFLFFVQAGPKRGIYLGSLDSADTGQLVAGDTAGAYAPAGYLLTVRGGVLMALRYDVARGAVSGEPLPVAQHVGGVFAQGAFSVSATGLLAYRTNGSTRRQLVWFDRRGTKLATLGPPEEQTNPELSPDDRLIAVNRSERGNEDIWLIDASNGAASRFTFDPGTDGAAVWAPDGSRLMFGSNRNGAFDLFEKPANRARDEQLVLTSPSNKAPADWSSDGLHLLYESQEGRADSRSGLWTLALEGTRKPQAFLQAKFDADEAQFSPDGRWVVYRSNESAQHEIYVRPFPGPGGQREISRGGGSSPRWRRDGKELFYIAFDGKLMAVPIGWPSEGRSLDIGMPVPLFSTRLGDPGLPKPQYAVSRDGQRFLMTIIADEISSSPITVVQNWTAAFTK